MKAHILDGCIGCGLCEGTCPEVFRINKDGIAEAFADVTAAVSATAKEAAESCPVTCIKIDEA